MRNAEILVGIFPETHERGKMCHRGFLEIELHRKLHWSVANKMQVLSKNKKFSRIHLNSCFYVTIDENLFFLRYTPVCLRAARWWLQNRRMQFLCILDYIFYNQLGHSMGLIFLCVVKNCVSQKLNNRYYTPLWDVQIKHANACMHAAK